MANAANLNMPPVTTAATSSITSSPSPLASMFGSGANGGMTVPQSLEQLLERQWEQGSQFLMEQAQHFDSKFQKHDLLEV